MNAWVRKRTTLFNFIDKKIKLDNDKYNLVSYKISEESTKKISSRIIYCNINIHKEVLFTDITIDFSEYDKFIRKTKIENLSKI